MRRRLPLIVFVLLAVVVVMLLGLACLTDDPMQAVERALSFVPALAVLVPMDAWAMLFAVVTTSVLLVAPTCATGDRASPALLQRFRF